MNWEVKFHPWVIKKDLPSLPKNFITEILTAIRNKLEVEPEKYGEPLRKELAGYWKLRVGKYRVIYRMKPAEIKVLVILIGPRKDRQVYKEMLQRTKAFLIQSG